MTLTAAMLKAKGAPPPKKSGQFVILSLHYQGPFGTETFRERIWRREWNARAFGRLAMKEGR